MVVATDNFNDTRERILPINELKNSFTNVRTLSELRCASLSAEDLCLQTAEFASPGKWHLAHTSWFFETFLLIPYLAGYQAVNPAYQVLFNSYYNGVGTQHPRGKRGDLSRPGLDEVMAYRRHVSGHIIELLDQTNESQVRILELILLGIEHEKQHQELFVTDLKYNLFQNPLYPAVELEQFSEYALTNINSEAKPHVRKQVLESIESDRNYAEYAGGLVNIGVEPIGNLSTSRDFHFDNECPQHLFSLTPFSLSRDLVSNREYLEFIEDGGYQNHKLWLADGWQLVQTEGWVAPLYWVYENDQWLEYQLDKGLVPLDLKQPVNHVSGYEADAFACWRKQRLPTEQEWEHAAHCASDHITQQKPKNTSSDSSQLTPNSGASSDTSTSQSKEKPAELFAQRWQWTSSAYRPYPGFSAQEGAVGEYNGKFMSNQWVLRGSSSATSSNHTRNTYRNFFYPSDRWQFTGIRLAK